MLAEAMVGRYRLGYEEMAFYLAGTLFETVINQKLIDHDNWSESMIEYTALEKKIERLSKIPNALRHDSLFDPQMRHVFTCYRPDNGNKSVMTISKKDNQRLIDITERLANFRWFRNQIMHGKLTKVEDIGDNLKDDLILYVWRELASSSFERIRNKWEKQGGKGRIFDAIFKHSADYLIRGIAEVDIRSLDDTANTAKGAWCITQNDFHNLFDMRTKMVELKNHLRGWLKNKGKHLHTNTLSTIDTTSAYIWMPLTRQASEIQQGVFSCTVALLATPLDFRIYMDFGGMAAIERQQYYNFLSSEEYSNIASKFVLHPDFYVFNSEWYSFITKKKSICSWLTDSRDNDIKVAQNEINPFLGDISDPITWNRMLHGYILDKEYLKKNGSIDLNMIEKCLEDVISFFSSFERFQLKNP